MTKTGGSGRRRNEWRKRKRRLKKFSELCPYRQFPSTLLLSLSVCIIQGNKRRGDRRPNHIRMTNTNTEPTRSPRKMPYQKRKMDTQKNEKIKIKMNKLTKEINKSSALAGQLNTPFAPFETWEGQILWTVYAFFCFFLFFFLRPTR